MSISATFDQLLRGGRVICPASGIDGIRDVAIRNGKIAAVQSDILATSAREVIDVTGKLVLPGLIDTHAHVYQYVTGRFGMNADMVGVQSGVTTLVDQGGPSCMTLPGFRHFVAEPAKSRVYAFMSAYLVGGLEGHYYPQLYSPDGVDIAATVKAATANLDIVRGIKAHAEIGGFARWGIRVIEMAAEIGRRADLPVYVHFGQLWGLPESGTNGEDVDTILARVIPLLREGDVLAHPFTRHPGGFVNREGEVHPVIQAALDRGLKVDVGHGSHFSYRLAKKAIAAGIIPTTLGADIHGYNTHVPAPAGTPDQHEGGGVVTVVLLTLLGLLSATLLDSIKLHEMRAAAGVPGELFPIEGADHFSMFKNVSIKMRCSRWCDGARKSPPLVRLSPGPPQWPDAVPARDARMNI